MKYLTFITILFISLNGLNAQRAEKGIQSKFMLKYVPTALFPSSTPMLQFAGESSITSNLGLQYEIGVLSSLVEPFNSFENIVGNEQVNGARLKVELRHYSRIHVHHLNLRHYWGGGIQVQQVYKYFQSNFLLFSSDSPILLTEVPIHKSISTVSPHLMYGYQWLLGSFVVDFNLSFGINYESNYNIIPRGFETMIESRSHQVVTGLFRPAFYIGYSF